MLMLLLQLEFDEDVTQVDREDYVIVSKDPLESSDSGTRVRCGSYQNQCTHHFPWRQQCSCSCVDGDSLGHYHMDM